MQQQLIHDAWLNVLLKKQTGMGKIKSDTNVGNGI